MRSYTKRACDAELCAPARNASPPWSMAALEATMLHDSTWSTSAANVRCSRVHRASLKVLLDHDQCARSGALHMRCVACKRALSPLLHCMLWATSGCSCTTPFCCVAAAGHHSKLCCWFFAPSLLDLQVFPSVLHEAPVMPSNSFARLVRGRRCSSRLRIAARAAASRTRAPSARSAWRGSATRRFAPAAMWLHARHARDSARDAPCATRGTAECCRSSGPDCQRFEGAAWDREWVFTGATCPVALVAERTGACGTAAARHSW